MNNINISSIRELFPILHQKVYNNPLIYFDNAATSQKPLSVLHALEEYYKTSNANIHRGAHALADRATESFEGVRKKVQAFIGAEEPEEIIFTKGTTESINIIAQSFGKKFLKQGDEILLSTLEHHSNIVPWQIISEEKQSLLKVIPITDSGEIIMESLEKLLTDRVKILSITWVSNTLGTINPIQKIIELAHKNNTLVLIDAAQAVAHLEIDVKALDIDFMVFSSHKMYGPTGVGVLYGKRKLLEQLPPYQGGGEMIKEVTFERTTYNDIPYKFEAGTPNIGDVIAFGAAIEFIESIEKTQKKEYEQELLYYATDLLKSLPYLRIIGEAAYKTSVISFVIENYNTLDIGLLLDSKGIAVRTGHHCTQPLMRRLGIDGTIRASFSIYNTKEEIDIFIDVLHKIIQRKKQTL